MKLTDPQSQLARLISRERELTTSIDRATIERTALRRRLEAVRLVLSGQQQSLPLEGCEPQLPAPRPFTMRRVSPLQRSVLVAAARVGGLGGLGPSEKRSASSLARGGLLTLAEGGGYQLTDAGRDVVAEIERGSQ